MTEEPKSSKPVSFEEARQRAIDVLCERFAEDAITVAEFERRVDLAHQAESAADLRKILGGLPSSRVPARRGDPSSSAVSQAQEARHPSLPSSHSKKRDLLVGIFGGSVRKGRWRPAERSLAIGFMGGVQLDFRNADLPPGVTEVTAIAVMGGVEIIVPPDVHVDTGGIAIMGGFDHAAEENEPIGPDTPVLRINGFACLGGVDIKTRYAGETPREARRRRRELRRGRRRLLDSFDDRS